MMTTFYIISIILFSLFLILFTNRVRWFGPFLWDDVRYDPKRNRLCCGRSHFPPGSIYVGLITRVEKGQAYFTPTNYLNWEDREHLYTQNLAPFVRDDLKRIFTF